MTASSKSLSACAPFVAPRLCSTKTRKNKKSANNIHRRMVVARVRGQMIFRWRFFVAARHPCSMTSCKKKGSATKHLSSAFFPWRIVVGIHWRLNANERTPRKVTLLLAFLVRIPMPRNADNEVLYVPGILVAGGAQLRRQAFWWGGAQMRAFF
jgi:hypothetical protein